MHHLAGPASDLHGREFDWSARSVTVCDVTAPALVLGSTQPAGHVAPGAEAAGVEVVRRRTGGSAVLVEPGALVWVEVVVPAADVLWEADVGRAGRWLGACWAAALADVGEPGAEVHVGGLLRSRWSAFCCFAGVGPGEVTLAGRKVVGVAQRRTRDGSVFQCAVPLRRDAARLAGLLALPATDRSALAADLDSRVRPLPGVAPAALLAAFVRHLPSDH